VLNAFALVAIMLSVLVWAVEHACILFQLFPHFYISCEEGALLLLAAEVAQIFILVPCEKESIPQKVLSPF